MPFCSRCGKEVPPSSTFCMHCGSPVAAPVPRPPPSKPAKVSHLKRNLVVMGIIILVLVVIAAGSSLGPSGTTSTTTTSTVQEGGTVTIGQPIIVNFESSLTQNEVPVTFIFNSASFNTTVGEYHSKADSGYKFLVVQVSVKNVGDSEVENYVVGDKWEVTVDKGYTYGLWSGESLFSVVQSPWTTLQPQDQTTGYIVFEILNDTTPLQVIYYKQPDSSPTIVLNLQGYTIQQISAAQKYLAMQLSDCLKIGSLTPQPMERVAQFVTLLFQTMRQ